MLSHRKSSSAFQEPRRSTIYWTGDPGDEDPGQETPDLRMQLLDVLEERGCGSVLRGWRSELDPEGSLQVTFQEMCRTASRLGLVGDVSTLFMGNQNKQILTLTELLPGKGALIEQFQEWVKEAFGGPKKMFKTFDKDNNGIIPTEEFLEACRKHGLEVSEKELMDIYMCCDWVEAGAITCEELLFLEVDPSIREFEAFNLKMGRKNQRQHVMANFYCEEQLRALKPAHRLAIRPWQAECFEKLPKVMCERRRTRQRETHRNAMRARVFFIAHLEKIHGNVMRAWRRELDPNGTFSISVTSLRQYCVRANMNVDTAALWRSLDKDGGGSCGVEKLSARSAEVLASFQRWALGRCGSCAALWDSPEAAAVRRIAHFDATLTDKVDREWSPPGTKMRFKTFTEVLRQLGWPGVGDAAKRSTLCASLDLFGCRFVARADLEWLDRWEPPSWLYTDPDSEAWRQLRELLGKQGKHLLNAWRCIFDADDSNSVTWLEFQRACTKLGFEGNVAGAWRYLDTSLDGYITMRDFDASSAELLASFKDWADLHFGSMKSTFKTLDTDADGVVSFAELKRACNRLKWQGDTHVLFNCLDIDRRRDHMGMRSISFEEVSFLDSWEPNGKELQEQEQEAAIAARDTSASAPTLPSLIGEAEKKRSGLRERHRSTGTSFRATGTNLGDKEVREDQKQPNRGLRQTMTSLRRADDDCVLWAEDAAADGRTSLPGMPTYWAAITYGAALEKWQHTEPRQVWRSPCRLHPLCPRTPPD